MIVIVKGVERCFDVVLHHAFQRSTLEGERRIDDDPAVLEMVQSALAHYGMEVHAYPDAAQAMELLQNPHAPAFDMVLSDINMEGMDGFDVIHRVKATHPHLPVALMTGQSSVDYAIQAMRYGASNLFMKPIALKDLVQSVFHLVDLHRDLRKADDGLRGLVNERRHFLFRSDELDIPSLMHHLTDRLVPMGFASASNIDVIAMAFHEALALASHNSLILAISVGLQTVMRNWLRNQPDADWLEEGARSHRRITEAQSNNHAIHSH